MVSKWDDGRWSLLIIERIIITIYLNETFFKVGQGYSFVSGFFLVGKEGKV